MLEQSFKVAFRRRLLLWYRRNRRNLPWRSVKDPYRILVSEMMLQQTSVGVATKYYLAFMERFPTVSSLAQADPGDVMKVWEGLGYYSRARNLLRAAQEILIRFGGLVPANQKDLRSLPGVGPYTAGAVLSIAYGVRVPVLDGNVVRVFTRVFRIFSDIEKVRTLSRLQTLAEDLLPKNGVGDFNQGLMELGALICRPKHPQCPECPVSLLCKARQTSVQERLPVRTPKKPIPHIHVTAGVIRKSGKFLITLRPPSGLLGGLWEFPGGKQEEGESLKECLKREIREELGITIDIGDEFMVVNHAYSHYRITLHVFFCRYRGGRIRLNGCDDFRWITRDGLDRYAFPAADRRVIRHLQEKQIGG